MQKFLATVLLATFAISTAFAQTEIKGSPEELKRYLQAKEHVVTLTASAEETAHSDQAIVNLVISTESKNLADSLKANGELRANITERLVRAGIASENIKTSKFSTSPQYGWFGKRPGSFKVVNRMAIRISTESQLQTIASVADANNDIELSQATFEHSAKDDLQNSVRMKAVAKIMERKKLYESALGISLSPVSFRDQKDFQSATAGANMLEEVIVTGSRARNSSARADNYKVSRAVGSSSFDEIKYSATVTVDFVARGGTAAN